MSLVGLAHVCSHLQNCTKQRLGLTSVPHTKLVLALMLGLQDQGFLASVTRGSTAGPDPEYTPTTQANVASRRLWLTLKYFDNQPVLSRMALVSLPSQRIWMGVAGLKELALGNDHQYVTGLQPGEVMYLSTDRGFIELREAVQRQIGGQLLCRAQ